MTKSTQVIGSLSAWLSNTILASLLFIIPIKCSMAGELWVCSEVIDPTKNEIMITKYYILNNTLKIVRDGSDFFDINDFKQMTIVENDKNSLIAIYNVSQYDDDLKMWLVGLYSLSIDKHSMHYLYTDAVWGSEREFQDGECTHVDRADIPK